MNSALARACTGLPGLDYVLDGGLPAGHIYLLEGNPGTGKTTLALQFLFAGRSAGENTLYVTLSETRDELKAVAASHGWSLDGIDIHQLETLDAGLNADQQYTVFHPAEVELNDTMQRICKTVAETNPSRVVFDSLSEMRLMARDSLRYRRQVLALKQFFIGRNCTVLLLDDNTSGTGDIQLQSISHGVINLERMEMEYGGARRRLQVSKLRGLKFRDGNHDYTIVKGGLVVFPRMVAAEARKAVNAEAQRSEVVPSDLPALDALLGDGLHRGTNTLVLGPAGSGKSTLVTQYAIAMAKRGERVAGFLFEETCDNFLKRAEGMNMSLSPYLRDGTLHLDQIDAAEVSPGEFADTVRRAVEERGVRMVFIDSLNGYLNAMPSESFLVMQIHELLTYLNQNGVVSLLVMAQHGFMGAGMSAPVEVSYLADTVIMLRYFEAAGEVKQAIAVVKKRTGPHERSIRQMALTNHGIQIGAPLTEFRGVLTGVPIFQGPMESLLRGGRDV